MKISCLPVSLFPDITSGRMTLKEWAQIGTDAGLDGIDLSTVLLENHTPGYLKRINEDLRTVGLPVVMITAYPDFSHPDALQRTRELEYLHRDIAVASALGAKYLRIVAGQAHPGIRRNDAIGWVIDAFKRAAHIAEKFSVRLVYENHSKPGSWYYPDFSHPTEIFLEIAAALRDTGVGINFDTGNTLVYGDDPLPVLEQVMDRVMTVHAADTATRGKLDPVPLGAGIVPFREIFSFLKSKGFDEWICIEEASRSGRHAIAEAKDFVRETWDA